VSTIIDLNGNAQMGSQTLQRSLRAAKPRFARGGFKWSLTLVGALGLFGFAPGAGAQEPTTPAPTAAAADPPAPDKASEPSAPNPPVADAEAEPGPEMTFGRHAARAPAEPSAADAPLDAPGATRPAGRARTMEDVTGAAAEELTVRNVRWRYSLNFFGDLSLSAGKPADPDHHFGFALGAQDLLIRGELSNNIVAATEMAFEAGPDGVGIDIERFHVRYQTSRIFVEAGRTHTGFGYWNNAYHHGRWLQPTIARPRWVAFEDSGGILPVHWVGAGVGARLPVSSATLNLMATIGNGRGHIVDDVRSAGDYQAMKAFHASAELVGIGRPELRVGLAGIYGKIPGLPMAMRPGLPDNQEIAEWIGGAHVAYVNVPLLLIAESYAVAHVALGHQWTTYGGFALVGYAFGRLTPFLELERIASKGGTDPFLSNRVLLMGSVPSFDTFGAIVGLRFDLSDWTALKVEYRQTQAYATLSTPSGTLYEGVLNWSWGF
jgi:hypothetical protein